MSAIFLADPSGLLSIYETGDIEMRQWRNINETHYARFVQEIADVIRRLGYFVECAIPVSVSRGIGCLSAHYWKMITMIKKNDVVIYGDSLEHRIPILENTHPLSGNKRLLIEYELLNRGVAAETNSKGTGKVCEVDNGYRKVIAGGAVVRDI